MNHPPPKGIAIAHCTGCARVSFARHVNQLDRVPRRYCRFCGTPVDVVLYTRDAEQPPIKYRSDKRRRLDVLEDGRAEGGSR